MNVLESFKHADTFAQMGMGDKLLATGYVILLGMGITFVALILIWFITALMSKIIQSVEKSKEASTVKQEPAKIVYQTPVTPVETVAEDDEELIAVITAAIAASLNTSMHNIRVSNIRRINDSTPIWGKTGRNEVMGSRM